MNKQEYLLTHFSQELSEVNQRITKALLFGIDEKQPGQPFTNEERILQEWNDTVAVLEVLYELKIFKNIADINNRQQIAAKKEKMSKFMQYSVECGTLTQAGLIDNIKI